jgi:hypothetical protein
MDPVETSSVQKTVNSRPEVAYGILCLSFYPPSSVDDTKKFSIEKLFGLVKEDNSVLKFRILVSGSWERKSETLFDLKVSHKVYYLSDEPIHCDLTIKDHAGERYSIIHTSMSCLDIRRILITSDDDDIVHYQIEFKIGQDPETQDHAKIVTNYANKLHNESTSDFRVKCRDEVFHVHKFILADRSEYFAAILRNNCLENKNEQLVIDDFKPHIVCMLLRFMYNGTVKLPFYENFSEMSDDLSGLMQIADKYNFMDLFDTCDSILAQYLAVNLSKFTNEEVHNHYGGPACVSMLFYAIKMFRKVQARKCAATIFLWKQEADLDSRFDDIWSGMMNDYPDFVTLAAKTASRKDYRKWHDQHRTWTFHTVIAKNTRDGVFPALAPAPAPACKRLNVSKTLDRVNSIAFIVGPFGDMKGAVQCAGQPIV